MNKLHLEILINAPKEKIWSIITQPELYKEWASAFSEGSMFEGSWEKGSKIRFLGPDENGVMGGMSSEIAENRPYDFISIHHVGIVSGDVEDTTSEQAKEWTPAHENYTLSDVDGQTKFEMDMDINPKYEEMFREMWTGALAKLKEMAERE